MIFEEMLREEKTGRKTRGANEATREGIFELLENLGEMPDDFATKWKI